MDKKKKILLVSNMYPSKKYPHYGVFVKNIYESLQKDFLIDKIVCFKQDSKVYKLINYIMFYAKVFFKVLFFSYDYIFIHYISHSSLPIILAKKIKPDLFIISNIHGNDLVPEDKKDEKMLKYSIKILKISNYVIVPSKYFKDILISNFNFDQNRIQVIPSGGINTEIFSINNRQPILSNSKIVFGFVSRIEINKGWDTYLVLAKELIKEYSNLHFIIVGQGKELVNMKHKIKEYGLDSFISYFHFMSQKDLAKLYKKIDIFCFPTRRKSESLGLVGLEAMACGTIILASNMYGPSSYIKNEINGFSFNPYNSNEFVEQAKKILSCNLSNLELIQKNALKTVKDYDSKKVKKTLIEFFKNIKMHN